MFQNCSEEMYVRHCEKQNENVQYYVNYIVGVSPTVVTAKTLQCTHIAYDHTYMDNIDIIIIGKCLQHFTDRSSDQFEG